jgi:serine/threonine protein kinase/tetratricopeptide (TPR) repeat protein
MQPEHWRQLEEIFQAALDCEAGNRSAFLDSACGTDAQLRSEVESLLASHEKSGFTAPAAFEDALRVLQQRTQRLEVGRRLGPYSVLEEIGRGGMGSVYLAARADDAYQKLVAIKIIRRELDSEDLVKRFRSERQILATLDHPNITRLLDGGTGEEGLPYLVMEYIEGEPIDRYCDARKLDISARLRLFQSVCAAVHYAHQNLVIHRDIKPGNVLVTKEGVPRLLDFGIAKLLAQPGPGDSTTTQLRPLTPEYASPEQVRGETITTASDVYSLGVLLHRLLTGRRPYGAPPSTRADIEKAICHEEPEKPSLAVLRGVALGPADSGTVGPTPESLSATREGTPEKLRRRLAGDLDNIVLLALRKEPRRRYASVEQFSQDINRHLSNLPVIARPDTRGYRAAKFIQRHMAGVAAAVLVFLVLSGGIAATLWQAHVARLERDRARVEQAKADRIKSFLTDTLSYSSPEYTSSNPTKNQDAKVSEVVDQAAKRAEAELADQPEVLTEVQSTIGGVYEAQGRLEQAEALLRAARENSIRLYGLNSHQTVEISGSLANTLLGKGKATEADALFKQGIQIERQLMAEGLGNKKNLAHALAGYGGMLDQRNDPAAQAYLLEVLKYSSAFTGKERTIIAMTYNDLSGEAYARGNDDEAERYIRAALDEYRKLPPATYVEMATALSNLGALLIKKGKYSEAEPFVLEGLQLRQRILGNAHPSTAMALYRLSDLRYRQGRYVEAETAAQQSIDSFKGALAAPQDNTQFTNPVLQMGMILEKVGRLKEAEGYLRQALEIRLRLVPKGNQLVGKAEGILGECLTLEKRYHEAEPLLLDSYKVYQSTTVPGSTQRLEAAQRLDLLYTLWGRPAQALPYKSVPSIVSR